VAKATAPKPFFMPKPSKIEATFYSSTADAAGLLLFSNKE
jgi:hypothetical protein